MSEQQKDIDLFPFFNEIGIIEQLSRNALEKKLPHGLKISQFSVLNHFARLGGAKSPAFLASAFQVTKGAMTNTLQRLDNLGFVTIISDPKDKRGKLVSITNAGLAARNDALIAISPMMTELLENIPATEFKAALPFLTSLRSYLDNRRF